ncbi:benzenediol:oxygen oxidoreductase [Echria macrotheca]|uniref:laccase n=1 Tax=Echria macrotheca TaxID=438768 RepID=A0AAJ0F4G3_9PEZI|nr:benzenediol:oxygen oxidoreductase [Echria macrotheca]
MKFLNGAVALLSGLLAPSALAAPPMQRDVELEMRNEIEPRVAPTCNTPSNRACWTTGFNINTDYETSTPPSGSTRRYTLNITEADNFVAPDGSIKPKAMLVNGPTIFADWGDNIEVTVINNLRTNGTAIHWHGLQQKTTQLYDGANGVTQCPIPPKGGSMVYKFRATQYGTSWYHSHFSAQYSNGVVGTIQINGPASLPYDIDLGVFPISDYYLKSADELIIITQNAGPPPSDNVFLNGTGKHPTTGQGQYANVTLTPGKRHRLRLINTSAENHFQLSLVGHQMTIIASDFVPVNAQTVSSVFLGVGQRYDVTIDASQTPGNYWFNVTFGGEGFCGSSNNPAPAAIFHYAGAPGGLPTNPGTPPTDSQCLDIINLTPVVTRTVPTVNFVKRPSNTLPVHLQFGGTPLFVWQVNGSAINVDWNKPVAEYVMTNNQSYPTSENLVIVDAVDQWTYWLVENDDPTGIVALPHPFHLHGHDFVVLGRSPDVTPASQTPFVFNQTTDLSRLNGNNPTRRDVTMLPARGWILIAFKTNNPGAWLMHCHIAWHVSGGLSVDFLERRTDFKNQISSADATVFNNNCNAWRSYFPSQDPFPKIDSGLKF